MHKIIFILIILTCVISYMTLGQIPRLMTHQGYVTDIGGEVVSDTLPMTFKLYDDLTTGTLVKEISFPKPPGVIIINGVYNVTLDVTGVIFNKPLYLEITINGELQTPRLQFTSAPYSQNSLTILGPGCSSRDTNTVSGGSNNAALGEFSVVSGGLSDSAIGALSTIAGGYQNVAIGASSTIGGGSDNKIGEGEDNTISGGDNNNIIFGGSSTISGGVENTVTSDGATISGGEGNLIDDIESEFSTIGGGSNNEIINASPYATIGGGDNNRIDASQYGTTIAGGMGNSIPDGIGAAIGGGVDNSASGNYSVIPGGRANVAAGKYSFAAGRRAEANHEGTFVWADSTDSDFASTAENQFLIRASGGVGIGINNPTQLLQVHDTIYSSLGGFKFPDGTVQTSAAFGGGSYLPLTGGQMTGAITNIGEPSITMGKGNFGGGNVNSGLYTFVAGFNDTASGDYSTVGGGWNNAATGTWCTVSGGSQNKAKTYTATVGGGSGNIAWLSGATVSGGSANFAQGQNNTVSGGYQDSATGMYSTVPGGHKNRADGYYSFAAGRRAKALHHGTLVWADWTDADFATTAENQFLIRASGGVGIGTTSPQGALDVSSTTGAFIVPRMTTAQRDVLTPVNGMIIYNVTTNQFNFRENGAWVTK